MVLLLAVSTGCPGRHVESGTAAPAPKPLGERIAECEKLLPGFRPDPPWPRRDCPRGEVWLGGSGCYTLCGADADCPERLLCVCRDPVRCGIQQASSESPERGYLLHVCLEDPFVRGPDGGQRMP